MAIKGACINIIESDNDSMHISKFSLEQLRKDKEIPASDSVSFLESLGVKDGAKDNIQSEKTIDIATQFFKEYKQKVADSNYDSPSLRDIADETIPGFRGLKLIAPIYYVLQKGGKSSKK